MNDFKSQCIELRKKDYTLPEIVKITGRPKTSVYFHIRDLPLSITKQRAINKEYGERIKKFSSLRKGKSKRKFQIFNEWDTELVLLVAHLLFDGEISSTGCIYNNRSNELISRVEDLMKKVYHFEPARSRDQNTGVLRISYYNVALSAYFKEKAEELLNEVTYLPVHLKREFIRAFFDDEGCMDFRPSQGRRRIRGYQKDISILHIVSGLLRDLNIESGVKKPNEVVIIGKENLKKFQKEINFSKGVRINGNRSNSVWKKSLEKREILKMAIDSFQ